MPNTPLLFHKLADGLEAFEVVGRGCCLRDIQYPSVDNEHSEGFPPVVTMTWLPGVRMVELLRPDIARASSVFECHDALRMLMEAINDGRGDESWENIEKVAGEICRTFRL